MRNLFKDVSQVAQLHLIPRSEIQGNCLPPSHTPIGYEMKSLFTNENKDHNRIISLDFPRTFTVSALKVLYPRKSPNPGKQGWLVILKYYDSYRVTKWRTLYIHLLLCHAVTFPNNSTCYCSQPASKLGEVLYLVGSRKPAWFLACCSVFH